MPAPLAGLSNESELRDRENGRAILGYLCAVNTATLSFMIRVVPDVLINPAPETVIFIIVLDAVFSWFFVLLTAVLPATVAYRIARSRQIHNIIYYLSCGAAIGALLTLLYIYMSPVDDLPFASSFYESYLWTSPLLMAVGSVGGVTFWYKAGRHLSRSGRPVSNSGRDPLFRSLALGIAAALFFAAPGLVVAPIVEHVWSQSHCTVEIRQSISNLSGFDFETTRAACDIRRGATRVGVSVSPVGQSEKTQLFEFVPEKDNDIPTISVTDPMHIVITIPVVSSVRVQKRDWSNVHIEYRIGRVVYGRQS